MPCIYGARPIRDMHPRILAKALLSAEDFWARCGSVEALPVAIDWLKEQLSDQPLNFYNHTQHKLAVPFVLARLGRHQEALAEMERKGFGTFMRDDTVQKLKALVAAEKA